MTIPDVLGVLGFALSLLIILWNIWAYYRRLLIQVKAVEVTQFSEYCYLVAFHVVFLNLSSQNKHVFRMSLAQPPYLGGKIKEPERWRIREDKDTLVVADENKNRVEFPLDGVLQLPLDIPPHQIQNKVYPLLLTVDSVDLQSLVVDIPLRIGFVALDHKGKCVARCLIRTKMRELTTEGLFPLSFFTPFSQFYDFKLNGNDTCHRGP